MHIRTMSFFTAQDHVPLIPSPLNPFAPSRRRRHSHYRGRIPMSPSEKLLRRKAAEAWRSEIIYRQVAAYEQRAIEALEMEHHESSQITGLARRWELDHERYALEGSLDRAEAMQYERRHRTEAEFNRFLPIPGLRFLTTRRLIKCMRFWRVFTPRRMKKIFGRDRVEVN